MIRNGYAKQPQITDVGNADNTELHAISFVI